MSSVNDTTYPRSWSFDEDGDTVEGTLVELSEAPTANGYKPVVTLDVAGEQRTVWLFHEALLSKFFEELNRRRAKNFTPGEHVVIERLDWKESETTGRRYRNYRVRFTNAPKRSASEILGTAEEEPAAETTEDDGELPF